MLIEKCVSLPRNKKSKKNWNSKNKGPLIGVNVILGVIIFALLAFALIQYSTISNQANSIRGLEIQIKNLNSTILALRANSTTVPITKTNLTLYNISNQQLPQPPLSLSAYPVITQQQPFGKRLTNINAPLNSTELAVINDAPSSYFETAGEMLLNGSIDNYVGVGSGLQNVSAFIVNGKPSVIYLGSITCIFCGENRWAMALALSRFGKFDHLFKGYSSFGDGDLPTLYWRPMTYSNASGAIDIGNFYNSSLINFITLEDTNPITQGFQLQSLGQIQAELQQINNTAYSDAFNHILQINTFSGTPYTIWGKYVVGGADAVDFGNTTPSSTPFPLTNMTHAQVLSQLASPSDQFAWTEYAGADVYIATMCASLNNSTQVCALPAIKGIESKIGAVS